MYIALTNGHRFCSSAYALSPFHTYTHSLTHIQEGKTHFRIGNPSDPETATDGICYYHMEWENTNQVKQLGEEEKITIRILF